MSSSPSDKDQARVDGALCSTRASKRCQHQPTGSKYQCLLGLRVYPKGISRPRHTGNGRNTVIKNPFFKCSPGEKYMDECDSCRCTDGHGGWCTNQFCEFRSLYLYAMKLSDGEFY